MIFAIPTFGESEVLIRCLSDCQLFASSASICGKSDDVLTVTCGGPIRELCPCTVFTPVAAVQGKPVIRHKPPTHATMGEEAEAATDEKQHPASTPTHTW